MTMENLIRQNCPELVAAGFDIPALSEMMDERFLGEFSIFLAAVGLFMEGYQKYVGDIQISITDMDRTRINATTHRLKGAASNFHNVNIVSITRDMEANSEVWDQAKLQEHMDLLNKGMTEFIVELNLLITSFSRLQEVAA